MTARKTPQGKPAAAQYAMGHDGLVGIRRTCRKKAAGVGQNRREKQLVDANGNDGNLAQNVHLSLPCTPELKVP